MSLAVAAGLLCLLIFAVDLMLPLGVASGVPYVAAVLLGLGSRRRRLATQIAVVATVLTLLGLLLSPQGSSPALYDIGNRLEALFAIWVTTLGVRAQIQTQEHLLQAQAKLREQQYLIQLGEMAAVVAHEVKNPLAGFSGVLQVLRGRFEEGSPDRQVIDRTLERLDGLGSTIRGLLDYARPSPMECSPVSLRALLEGVASHLAATAEYSGIRLEIHGEDHVVSADSGALSRALLNLAINGAQAMEGQGTLRVEVESIEGRCRVTFSDSGPGIPEAVQALIFQPFYTTRIQGMGLGLAIVQQTAEAHGGALRLLASAPTGTTIALYLPSEEPPL